MCAMALKSINPATGETIQEYSPHSPAEVENRLKMASSAQRGWWDAPFERRTELLSRLAELLRQEQESAARVMTLEMGKPIVQARAEVEKCAWVCDFYARNAEQFLTGRTVETDAAKSYIRYEPLGLILCVMPWNFPFWQVFRFAAPAVMAGNATILKHASNVCGVALFIEKLFAKAEFPAGLFTTLLLPADEAEQLVEHSLIRAVTLTGSERAGRALAARGGKSLKKAVLELGGSDPFVVLADADVPQAVEAAVAARTQNSGQSCIAAKRFIVEKPVADEFVETLAAETQKLQVGDPLDERTDVGPLAREDLCETLHQQVTASVEAGADLRLGGSRANGRGYYYLPTILGDVQPGMPAFDEETFGPVSAVVVADDVDNAIALANASRYGLGASIWTEDRPRGEILARHLQAGCVSVNEIVKSDPRLPFGGIKQSGYGRELSEEGIREFVNCKTVRVG
jgi:succinate-semialdehyde dehydrogenase/glutarate-semialdehyde dehydrogenase